MVVALSDISRWSKPDPPSESAPEEEVETLSEALPAISLVQDTLTQRALPPENLKDVEGRAAEAPMAALEESSQYEQDLQEGSEPGPSACESLEDPADSDSGESKSEAAAADPLKQYVLAMSTSLFLIWLPFAINATGVLGGKYEFAGARAQAMVNIFTACAVPISLIGIIVCGGKTKSIWASVGLALFLVVALAVGGLPLAFKAAGTWQALMRDSDPNLQKLNEEPVNPRTRLVLYSYNPPLERTRRVLRAEEEVLPGVLLIKLQAQKSD